MLLDGKGEVLDLGRQQRLFSPAQKRAMIARDGPWCIVPGCRVPGDWCDAHHFDPWEAGGRTDMVNGGHVCSGHHHDIHDRRYRIERLPTGVYRFTAPDGRVGPATAPRGASSSTSEADR